MSGRARSPHVWAVVIGSLVTFGGVAATARSGAGAQAWDAALAPSKTIPTLPPSSTVAPASTLAPTTLPPTTVSPTTVTTTTTLAPTTTAPASTTSSAPASSTTLAPVETGVDLPARVSLARLAGAASGILGPTADVVAELRPFVPELPGVPVPRQAAITSFLVVFTGPEPAVKGASDSIPTASSEPAGDTTAIDATVDYHTPVPARDVVLFLHATMLQTSYVATSDGVRIDETDGVRRTTLSYDAPGPDGADDERPEFVAVVEAADDGGSTVRLEFEQTSLSAAAAVLGGWLPGLPILDRPELLPVGGAVAAATATGGSRLELRTDYVLDQSPADALAAIADALPAAGYTLEQAADDQTPGDVATSADAQGLAELRLRHSLVAPVVITAVEGPDGGAIVSVTASHTL